MRIIYSVAICGIGMLDASRHPGNLDIDEKRISPQEALRAAVSQCETDVNASLAALGGSPASCGDISFKFREYSINYDFATESVFSSGGDVTGEMHVPVLAHSAGIQVQEFCISKIIRNELANDFSFLDLIPIPSGVVKNSNCENLVQFYVGFYGGDEEPFLDEAAWQTRAKWTIKFVIDRVKLLDFLISRGVSPGRHRYYAVGSQHDLKFVSSGFGVTSADPIDRIRVNLNYLSLAVQKVLTNQDIALAGPVIFDTEDPIFQFIDAVDTSENYAETLAKLIEGFSHPVRRPLGPLQVELPHALPAVAQWWSEFETCLADGARIIANHDCVNVASRCSTEKAYTLNWGPGSVMIHQMLKDGKGTTAEVFSTSIPSVIQKVVTTDKPDDCPSSIRIACSERASLRVLNGLDGRSPKAFDIESADTDSDCSFFSIFMERMPGIPVRDWMTSNPRNADVVSVYAQLIRILRDIHQAGFAHNDAHSGNVMVDTSRASLTVRLIDFGFTRPMVDKSGKPIHWAGKSSPMKGDLKLMLGDIQSRLQRMRNAKIGRAIELINKIGFFRLPKYDEILSLLEDARREVV